MRCPRTCSDRIDPVPYPIFRASLSRDFIFCARGRSGWLPLVAPHNSVGRRAKLVQLLMHSVIKHLIAQAPVEGNRSLIECPYHQLNVADEVLSPPLVDGLH
jgi:hypothetical protein